MRIVLTGGGTGGHIYPALSVAQCLEGDDLLYVGSADGPEAAIVPKAGLEFRSVPTRKLSRNRHPATRDPKHERILAAIRAERLREARTRLPPVAETRYACAG